MPRTPTTLRLSTAEKRILRAAAKREDRSMADLIREEALSHAATVLEGDPGGAEAQDAEMTPEPDVAA